jgi:hypothetical protein
VQAEQWIIQRSAGVLQQVDERRAVYVAIKGVETGGIEIMVFENPMRNRAVIPRGNILDSRT